MTTFKPHPNNVSTTLSGAHASGDGSLVLAVGTGAKFGSVFPMMVVVATAASAGTVGEINTIFNATARTGDTLTVSGPVEGTSDRAYAVGDVVEVRWTSGLAQSIETAVNGVENSTGITAGVIAAARLGTGTPSAATWLRGDGAWSPIQNGLTISGNTTLSGAANNWIMVDATSAAITVTLPVASTVSGMELVIIKKDVSANVITVQRQGTDTFLDATTSKTLTGLGKFMRLIAGGGTLWYIVGSN